MIYSHFNELRRYNERRRAERIDSIVAKVSIILLILLIGGAL